MSDIAPGTTVTVAAAAIPGASSSSTGAWFTAGITQRGPVGIPIALTSLGDFETLCGSREANSPMYDAAELYFIRGGSTMWLSRVVGPAATAASVRLNDGGETPQPTLKVAANGPGVAGNALAVSVLTGPVAGSYLLQISQNGAIVETSPPLVTVQDAVNWGNLVPASTTSPASKWVTITSLGSNNPNPAPAATQSAQALTGGTDDDTNAGDTQFAAALNVFTADMGPGQVSAPGRATAAVYTALLNHAKANNRFALLDTASPGLTAAEIVTAANAGQNAAIDPSFGTVCAPYITWPGIPTGTPVPSWPRQIPASAAAAALMSVNDASNDCNVAAAGPNGIVTGATGVSDSFVESDRAALNAAGVSLFRAMYGNVVLYGYQSMATDPRWYDAANCRFRMQLVHDAQLAGDSFMFAQIDGGGKTISAFNGALVAVLTGYYNSGSLYGATPADAFSVETGPTVNTPATIANRQLNAIENVVMSPSAEAVQIEIVKYLSDQSIPASS